ncbi:alpha/beta hydrolase [Pseudomonas sp. v388]|uniref:alpha/beta hydrolase n=1 Tax=Pseudomonas sp. v388 TaxID=2479849 RepID=UPI000F788D44|nr:alpha/beta hydrolase [Pseudomonas sp. v388]RRV10294.1 alpha/beta hydrolase [Pseudomonas sp. v388]
MDSNVFGVFNEADLAQVRRFNTTLARLPRFRIRNRVTPRVIQALLRAGQLGSALRFSRHRLNTQTRVITLDGVSVPLRIMWPKGQPQGVVLDFHGGGWVIGNAQMNDAFNVAMVNECNVITVSVDYRLAVSAPVQDLLTDCLYAARWLLDESNREFAGLPVVVVGESAGGHLAAATLLGLKTWPGLLQRVSGALLYYGVFDLTGTPSVRTAGPDTLLLDGPGMVDAFRMLTPDLTDLERRQPPLSPLYGDLTGFPPALMVVGDLDPLRDDTLQMAERWRGSAEVEHHLLPDCPHGFIHFPTRVAARTLEHSRAWISRRIMAERNLRSNHPGGDRADASVADR